MGGLLIGPRQTCHPPAIVCRWTAPSSVIGVKPLSPHLTQVAILLVGINVVSGGEGFDFVPAGTLSFQRLILSIADFLEVHFPHHVQFGKMVLHCRFKRDKYALKTESDGILSEDNLRARRDERPVGFIPFHREVRE